LHKSTPKTKEDPKDARKKELDPKLRVKTAIKGIKGRPISRSGSEDIGKSTRKPVTKTKAGKVVPEKPKRKPVEVSYKGTMRPTVTQAAYRGTANPRAPAARERNDHYARDRYGRRYSDDEDEEGDEDGYDSAASSDMEAGAWDIDEEEDFALRKAKAEDAAAKREEEEHKRQKLLRKQALAQAPARRRL
jgi:hypothetical protein